MALVVSSRLSNGFETLGNSVVEVDKAPTSFAELTMEVLLFVPPVLFTLPLFTIACGDVVEIEDVEVEMVYEEVVDWRRC